MLKPGGEWRWAFLAMRTFRIRLEEWVNYDLNTQLAYIAMMQAEWQTNKEINEQIAKNSKNRRRR